MKSAMKTSVSVTHTSKEWGVKSEEGRAFRDRVRVRVRVKRAERVG
jgi:hypothetical protein